MSVHKKLMEARITLQNTELKKSGLNKFAGYKYFELGDFLPQAQRIMQAVGLCGVVSFSDGVATLTITDIDDKESITITSPMGSASLKGCHEVQNIGAVETYQRRYLWVTAFEIVEHDVLDATTNPAPMKHTPLPAIELDIGRAEIIERCAHTIVDLFNAGDVVGAFGEAIEITDSDEKIALWKKLPSNVRAAIKKHGELIKEQI